MPANYQGIAPWLYNAAMAPAQAPAAGNFGPLADRVSHWTPAYKRKFLQGGGYQGFLARQLAHLHQSRGDAGALVGPIGQGTVLQDIQRRYGQPLSGVEDAQAIAGPLGRANPLANEADAMARADAARMGRTPHAPPQGAPHVAPDMDTSHLPAWEQGALAQLGGPALGTYRRRPRF